MKKVKSYILPVIVLLSFVAIMTTGGLLKKPMRKNDDVMGYIDALKKDVTNENWKQAEANLKNLKTAWKIVEKRVQFSVERDEMHVIDTSIARIGGALDARDKASALIEISEIINHWDELEK